MTNDNYTRVMSALEEFGTAQNRKVYKRHGAGDNLFGVSFANLKQLAKKIKKDHELALQLWETNNVDARTLAAMIADPTQMTEELLDTWINDISYYVLVDVFVSNLVTKTPFAQSKMEEWADSNDEWKGRAGWRLVAHLAMEDNDLTNEYFDTYLNIIEDHIHESLNRTKEAMNGALIAIGLRNNVLERKALRIAEEIGEVVIDHAETSCKTSDAVAYINKTKSRRKKKQ